MLLAPFAHRLSSPGGRVAVNSYRLTSFSLFSICSSGSKKSCDIRSYIRSVWLGLGYIPTPVIGDRVNTARNLWIKSVGGMVPQKEICHLVIEIRNGCKMTVIFLRKLS